MPLDFSNFESVLQGKLDTITDEKDMLLLGKAIEATVGNVAASDIQTEGTTQTAAVSAEGSSQISAVQAQGTSERNQINNMSSQFATSASLSAVATSGDYNDLSNQPAPFDPGTLHTVATNGDYNSLNNKPTIPAGGGRVLAVHHWKDNTHRSFGTGGIHVLSNTWGQVGTNSKFIITAQLTVGAGDNVGGYLQQYKNGSWSANNDWRGQGAACDWNNTSWGDLAHRHEDGMPSVRTVQYVWQPNTSGTLGARMYVRPENGTRYINRRNGWGNDCNNGLTGVSSLTVMEIET